MALSALIEHRTERKADVQLTNAGSSGQVSLPSDLHLTFVNDMSRDMRNHFR